MATNIHEPVPASTGAAAQSGAARQTRPRSGWLKAAAGIAVWVLVLVVFQQGLQRGIGFSPEEAWVLAIGLMTMIGMLIGLLLVVAGALASDM
jgi:hypothetical protein